MQFLIKEDGPIPQLAQVIARQKAEGGYIITYVRAWSFLVVTQTQKRVAHVRYGHNRIIPGLKHTLFTLFLGPWSLLGLFVTPMYLIVNLLGGVDVTAKYSATSVDPMRDLPPTLGQAERDFNLAIWIFIGLGLFAIAWMLWSFFAHGTG